MKISSSGLDLIKQLEGCELTAYPDPATGAEPFTIGYGSTSNVKLGECITQEEAEKRLLDDLQPVYDCIESYVDIELTQNQFDALCSWIFNLGCGNFRTSTLRTLLNVGNFDGAKKQFLRWTRGAGKVMPGLVKRRFAEAELFAKEPS